MPSIPRPLNPPTNPNLTSSTSRYIEYHLQEGWANTCGVCGDKAKCHSSIAYQKWANYCNKCWVKHFLPDYQQKLRDNATNPKTSGKTTSKTPTEEDDAD